MNRDVLGLCKDVIVKALSPDTDVPDTELWYSVYRLLQTLYFSDSDLLVIEEEPLRGFLIAYRQQFLTTNYDLFLQTKGWTMEIHGSTEALGLLLEEAIRQGRELQLAPPHSGCSIANCYIIEFQNLAICSPNSSNN